MVWEKEIAFGKSFKKQQGARQRRGQLLAGTAESSTAWVVKNVMQVRRRQRCADETRETGGLDNEDAKKSKREGRYGWNLKRKRNAS